MAVVFISPKQRQKTFFLGIAAIFVLFLIGFAFTVFFSQPERVAPELVFHKPKISIDMRIFDSEQFLNLQPFSEMKIQFAYEASTKENGRITGFVSAVSIDEARKILTEAGMNVVKLEQAKIGRENPFIPY